MQEQMQRGRIVTEQIRAEKTRKKQQRSKHYKPGSFHYGLHHRQSISGFMQDVKERRQQKRDQKD